MRLRSRLHQRAQRGQQQGEQADDRHQRLYRRREGEERIGARDEIDAGGDHRGGMDQRAHRRGAGHGVGQPGLQAAVAPISPPRRPAATPPRQSPARTHRPVQQRHDAALGWICSVPSALKSRKRPIASAASPMRVMMKAFIAARTLAGSLIPEADEQIAAQPHAFPAEIEQQQVIRQHQREHGADEQVHIGEKARISSLAGHVADRIQVDEEADHGDDQHHHHGQRIEIEGDAARRICPRSASVHSVCETACSGSGGRRQHEGGRQAATASSADSAHRADADERHGETRQAQPQQRQHEEARER